MFLRYRHLKPMSRHLPRIFSGNHFQQSSEAVNYLSACSLIPAIYPLDTKSSKMGIIDKGFHSQRYPTISEASNESTSPVDDVLLFIQSTFDQLQGPSHCWLNKVEGENDYFKKDGIFLVLAGEFLRNSEIAGILDKFKSLHQKFPELCIMGLHYGTSVSFADDKINLVELIMKEYISFPILLSSKNFLGVENKACCVMFRDFMNPVIHFEKDLDLGIILSKGIEELRVQQNGKQSNSLKRTWVKQSEVIKEPESSSSLQNLLLYFPSCVSADDGGDRLFLSDSNHHRIIIFDINGKIMDCIGSCPGFEDGEFESARLLRPAATFYHDAEDCLYIVDSENQAIRRADMERRVLETLYPTSSSKIHGSIWSWILNKMGFSSNINSNSKEFDSQLEFPWHLLKSGDSFFIINRSFETLWIMDVASGEIKESIKGFSKIWETCGHLIMEKVSLSKQMPSDWLQLQIDTNFSPKGLPFANLVSSVTTFENYIVLCDTVAQRVLKLNRESGDNSNIQFSNFGILGFPYWPSFPFEHVYPKVSPHRGFTDHLQCFKSLPGRINIQLNVEIPVDFELVEPLQEGCIWRQARGSATEILGREDVAGSSEKVGAAQQWYDDLDNLAFSSTEPEMIVEESNTTSDIKSEDGSVHIDCSVNTSPGTSEVIIYAALYLKPRKGPGLHDRREKTAARIVDIQNPEKRGGIGRDSCIQLLLKSNADLSELILMKPLHVRIKLDCLDHPKADNGKDIILTESAFEVDVKL